ncbi:putative ubiquitinyl hydrolase 1 [Helianthus anomalus]
MLLSFHDLLKCIFKQVTLSHPNAELRLLEVFYHKIYKFPLTEKIENINDQYWTLRAEEQVQNFGEPFFLIIHENETLADVKVRIQRKLEVPDENFSKVGSFFNHKHLC